MKGQNLSTQGSLRKSRTMWRHTIVPHVLSQSHVNVVEKEEASCNGLKKARHC